MPSLPKPKRPKYHPPREQPGNKGKNAKLYNSWDWRKLSTATRKAATIERAGIGCEVCYLNEGTGGADVTDHIVPIEQGGAVWDGRNHMALCHHHHNKKRGYEKHGLGIEVMRGDNGLIPVDRMEVIDLLINGRNNESS